MKKNVIFRIAAVVLMCTLVTACFASSTFAKYTAQADVTTKAVTVADWSIKVDNNEIAKVDGTKTTLNIDLATTITGYGTDDETGADADVKTDLIAPGTKGQYKFKVTNDSEVTAEFKVTIGDVVWTNMPAGATNPLEKENPVFVNADGNPVTLDAGSADGYYKLAAGEDVYVLAGWHWAFTDTNENAWGMQTTSPTATVTATIDVQQYN